MIYVYTSILNGWDNLRPPAISPELGVRYLCFTNLPQLPRVEPWEFRPAYRAHPGEPWRDARVPKILPHLMLPEDVEYSIYHDGNFQLAMKPSEVIGHTLGLHDWAAHRHPCRTCIYQEADILLREGIGTRALVEQEIARYRELGYPEGHGLWANGLLVRRHTPAVARLNELWWRLYSRGCERDQLSFPVARQAEQLAIHTIASDIWQSPYMIFRWHAAFRERDDCPAYWPERERLRVRLAELARVTGSDGGVRYPEY